MTPQLWCKGSIIQFIATLPDAIKKTFAYYYFFRLKIIMTVNS